jgi:UDP-N-acetylmuramate dehydrogenase
MIMERNASLKAFNTFGVDAAAQFFCEIDSLATLREAINFRRQEDLSCLVLGGGSNVLFTGDYPGLVLVNRLKGIRIDPAVGGKVLVTVAAGENWNEFVQYCLAHGCYGLENLALIPGCVGAAPIQNIGAYGVEVSEFIRFVKVKDLRTDNIDVLSAAECGFAYRDSVFKHELEAKKCVIEVGFELSQSPEIKLSYPALRDYFSDQTTPSPQQVFDAVCAIRRSKLPDPDVLGNAGSFFKNPVISAAQFESLLVKYPAMPSFRIDSPESEPTQVKVPAAWLIDKAGLKGARQGAAAVHEQQALVIVNQGGASAHDILTLAQHIMARVDKLYDIRLEPEVQWLPKDLAAQ